MRRIFGLVVSVALIASLVVSSAAAAPRRANNFKGSFDILESDGSVVGHATTEFWEATEARLHNGTFDVTWVPGARFPFEQQDPGVVESHAQVVAGWFGIGTDPYTGDMFNEFGISGFICDYSAPGEANCHDFSVVFLKGINHRNDIRIGFADTPNPSYDYDEWYQVGKGSFVLHYYAPTPG